ncbi:protein kinase [Marinobacter guineae]|uniref:Protein kinase n=1 Tax=Marinobacter guineae TaxID=432303 RepID=A0A2G1VDQ8_9GAMM|nr:bifunctional protein-serine/threonine kinase/phosphatase [Marinobacter guineae]PHQ24790.1 protein kinase [Marinobacter guineae]
MATSLSVSSGQHTEAGKKPVNQDFHGLLVPDNHQLLTKGIAVAIADGVSSSNVSQIASESAVAGFFSDYFSTPDSWSVKQSVQRVLRATNAWLYAQTRQSQYRYDRDRGYVCTLSVMVLKSATAHIFHVGDARIYRVHPGQLERLTNDHRLWLSQENSCLTRAMGIGDQLDIDYQSLPIQPGDTFLLATDGIHEHIDERRMAAIIRESGDDLDAAARRLSATALEHGSSDNLTAQIIRIDSVPSSRENSELFQHLANLPFAPELQPGQTLDGYRIQRQLHASSRSHVYLAVDEATEASVVLKLPSMDQRHDPVYLEQFFMEQWIARRLNSPHVVRPFAPDRQPGYLYLATEFVAGCTLRQWLLDNPAPDLETVRKLVEQIARGLRAFHRLEMVHQDLKPENVLVDTHGTVTLIDFGATRVAGLQESDTADEQPGPRGAALFSAPETFLGDPGSPAADQFSLGVITYQLLTGQLPYGAEVPKLHKRSQLRRLTYQPAGLFREDVPGWVDDAIEKAVHPQAHKRYPALSEYLYDLRHPGRDWQGRQRPPLIERHPVAFWQGLSALLLLALLASLAFD